MIYVCGVYICMYVVYVCMCVVCGVCMCVCVICGVCVCEKEKGRGREVCVCVSGHQAKGLMYACRASVVPPFALAL